jgi:hypothetical protein
LVLPPQPEMKSTSIERRMHDARARAHVALVSHTSVASQKTVRALFLCSGVFPL